MPKCKVCGYRLGDGVAKCPMCGAAAGSTMAGNVSPAANLQKSFCPSCGTEILGEHRYCTSCGADLKKANDTAVSLATNPVQNQPNSQVFSQEQVNKRSNFQQNSKSAENPYQESVQQNPMEQEKMSFFKAVFHGLKHCFDFKGKAGKREVIFYTIFSVAMATILVVNLYDFATRSMQSIGRLFGLSSAYEIESARHYVIYGLLAAFVFLFVSWISVLVRRHNAKKN